MNFENLPDELKALDQWLCYRSYFDKVTGKYRKIIDSPITGDFGKCNDPKTWSDYKTAKLFCLKNKYQGLAFALSTEITFIDIDHAINVDTGEIVVTEAIKLIELLPNTYIESSLSGTGLHFLLRGNLPENALKRNDAKGIEMYDSGRFICMTGNLLSESKELGYDAETVREINSKYIGVRQKTAMKTFRSVLEDEQLIEKICSSRQGVKFQNLFHGDYSGYLSHSNADFALCSILAWWTQDPVQIDRIVRSSGLYREKWDRCLGNSTYGQVTIENALQNCSVKERQTNESCM